MQEPRGRRSVLNLIEDGYFTKEEAKAYSQELLRYSTPTGINIWGGCENDRDDITDIPVYDLTTKSFVSGE